MKLLLHQISLLCFLCLSEYILSSPLHHVKPIEVHVDLIDSIFQIPINTLNGVANILQNVRNKKRNFISINVQLGKHPRPDHYPSPDKYPSTAPSGFPDYRPDYTPVLPGSTTRPVTGTTDNFAGAYKPETTSMGVNEPAPLLGGVEPDLITETQQTAIATEEADLNLEPSEQPTTAIKPSNKPTIEYKPSEKPILEFKPPNQSTLGYKPSVKPNVHNKPTENRILKFKPQQPTLGFEPSETPNLEYTPSGTPNLVYNPSEQSTLSYKYSSKPLSGYKPPEKAVAVNKPIEKPVSWSKPIQQSTPSSRPSGQAMTQNKLSQLSPSFKLTGQPVAPSGPSQPVQPFTRAPLPQPLSIEAHDKPSNRDENFKEYVQRKLAEKNLQDNRISNTF